MKKELIIDMRDLVEDIASTLKKGQTVTLRGEGNSMRPTITSENTLVLGNFDCDRIRCGEIYLYKRADGSYAIHRVYAVRKNCVWMVGDAQLFIEKDVPKSNLVGRVLQINGNGKTVECTSEAVRILGVIHMKCRIPAKKCYFRCYAVVGKMMRLLIKLKRKITKE